MVMVILEPATNPPIVQVVPLAIRSCPRVVGAVAIPVPPTPIVKVELGEKAPFNIKLPFSVKAPVPVWIGPLFVFWSESVLPEPMSKVVDAAPVKVVKDESPVILVPLKVIAAIATETPTALATKAKEVTNATTFFTNIFTLLLLLCLFILLIC